MQCRFLASLKNALPFLIIKIISCFYKGNRASNLYDYPPFIGYNLTFLPAHPLPGWVGVIEHYLITAFAREKIEQSMSSLHISELYEDDTVDIV
jgi:hypothetical protein